MTVLKYEKMTLILGYKKLQVQKLTLDGLQHITPLRVSFLPVGRIRDKKILLNYIKQPYDILELE
jgi:hypothetical protein